MLHHLLHRIIAAFFVLSTVLTLAAAAPVPTPPRPPPPPPTTSAAVDWPTLLKNRASPDYATRNAAQAQLENLPLDQYDTLKQRAAGENDPEVKAGLQAALEAMTRTKFLLSSPLSIDVRNATLADVAQALNKALNANLIAASESDGERFTLSARQRPFWEIISQVAEQTPLRFSDLPDSRMTIGVFRPSTDPRSINRPTFAIGRFGATKASVTPRHCGGGPYALRQGLF